MSFAALPVALVSMICAAACVVSSADAEPLLIDMQPEGWRTPPPGTLGQYCGRDRTAFHWAHGVVYLYIEDARSSAFRLSVRAISPLQGIPRTATLNDRAPHAEAYDVSVQRVLLQLPLLLDAGLGKARQTDRICLYLDVDQRLTIDSIFLLRDELRRSGITDLNLVVREALRPE